MTNIIRNQRLKIEEFAALSRSKIQDLCKKPAFPPFFENNKIAIQTVNTCKLRNCHKMSYTSLKKDFNLLEPKLVDVSGSTLSLLKRG